MPWGAWARARGWVPWSRSCQPGQPVQRVLIPRLAPDLLPLQTTRIGVAVNGVRKHCSNKEVVALAKVLIRNWKQLLGEGSRSLGPSVSPHTWVLVWLLNDSATTPSGSDRVCLLHKCGVCRWASFRVCPYVCISVCFMSVYTSVYTHWCVEMSFCPHA